MTALTFTSAQSDRAAGVLLAQACGDALGAPTEFQPAPLPATTPIRMTGGGALGWAPGEWTDDTQMSIVILQAAERALADGDELLDHLDDIAAGWIDWARHARDVGSQTRHVLGGGASTANGLAKAAAALHSRTGRTAGNGSLMRTAPVALATYGDPELMARTARTISEMTHHDPHAGDACVIWCAAIQHAIEFGELDLAPGLAWLPEARLPYWIERIAEAEDNDAKFFGDNGWVAHALQAAWSLITRIPVPVDDPAQDSYPAQHLRLVLEGAARLAGDTDTVAAIAGALVGARWGASAVSFSWRRAVHGWPGLTGSELTRRAVAVARRGCDSVGWPLGDRVEYSGYGARHRLVPHPADHGVWLGDVATAEDLPEGIDAVVSLCRMGTKQITGIEGQDLVEVWLIDTPVPGENPNLTFVLADAADAVAALRAEGKTVLLHCVAAQSRTPTVAAVYAVRHLGGNRVSVMNEVCRQLPDPRPNEAFRAIVPRFRAVDGASPPPSAGTAEPAPR